MCKADDAKDAASGGRSNAKTTTSPASRRLGGDDDDYNNGKSKGKKQKPLRLLMSLESFRCPVYPDTAPSFASCAVTGALIVTVLAGLEILTRLFLEQYGQYWHPLLTDDTNRRILARHVGVDAFSCAVVAWLGWRSRHVNGEILLSIVPKFGASNQSKNAPPVAGYEQRLFTYHPDGFRIALFFFMYQIKNLYDTLLWGDGPEFIFHHVFSLITAWGAMTPGCGHCYTIFFMGLSEISTAVLCLLAMFDDEHGVPGLGDAFPLLKVGLGASFAFLFVLCRCILWPVHSYYFGRDILQALKGDDVRAQQRKGWMKFFLVSLTGLSILQVAWLGEIFVTAKAELTKMGFL